MKYIKYLFVLVCVLSITISVKAFDIPEADVTYTVDWDSTLIINEDKTVKIINMIHDNTGTSNGAAIKITNNSTVNLVFEGNNRLVANPTVISAGIEVEEGSTVNIYGTDGSSLTVIGGKYGAGIGGTGYGSASETNPKAGNINIYSGDIKVYGGDKGAGIGSGFHSSASTINIYDGNIEAYGSGGGAGIGNGYGTAGGAAAAAGVGYYNGGNITISGGNVKAAAYHINFDAFDPYDLSTLYSDGYSDSFAAGIGGGYGSSSGNIVIEGSANVIAIGSCGGAGIGTGRGTTKLNNYDEENFNVNVTIKGNANVMAFATDDRRTTVVGDNGGAAIGLGRGTTVEGSPKGTVKIEGTATVYAVASHHAQAIGASNVVGKFTKDSEDNISEPPIGALAELSIAPTANVIAISDGYSDPISATNNFVKLNFNKDFLEKIEDNYFPLKVNVFDSSNTSVKSSFAIQNYESAVAMVQLANTENYNLQSPNYSEYYLANSIEEKMIDFKSGNTYDVDKLSYYFIAYSTISTDYGDLIIEIYAPVGVFEVGSQFNLELVYDEDKIAELMKNTDAKNLENLDKVFFIDIGVTDSNGNKYTTFEDYVKVSIQIPEGWDPELMKVLFVTSNDDEDLSSNQRVVEKDGIKYLEVKLNHFSDYGVFLYKQPVNNPNTSDNIITYIILFMFSLISILTITRIKKYN